MKGYELKSGEFHNVNLNQDQLWGMFSGMFSGKVHDTTYKYGFFKAILDSLYNTDDKLNLSFDQLFYKFTEIYWNLVLKYRLKQKAVTRNGRITALERVLFEAVENDDIISDVSFEAISDEMKVKICKKVKSKCKNNVVGALYGDSGCNMYSFSVKNEYIRINPCAYSFMTKHKVVLEKINYFEWAKFLEKVNSESSTRNLLNNLDTITLRKDLSYYRKILLEEFEERKCFYCGKTLVESKIHVDHFIPWSFIKDDNLWNFVLSCPQCNISKSNKLTSDLYLDRIIERNNRIIELDETRISKTYNDSKLRKIHYWAKFNGYNDIWTPTRNIK